MDTNSLSLAGGVLTALVAGMLLLTRKYSRTWLLVIRSSYAFWGYLLFYGLLGGVSNFIVFSTVLGRIDTIFGIPNYLFWPIAIALIGTLAKSSLVGALPGADQFDITVRTVLLLFEPEYLDHIATDEYFARKKIVRRVAARVNDYATVLRVIRTNIPDHIERTRRLTIADELEQCTSVEDAMMYFLRLVGPRWFEFAFAEPESAVHATLLDHVELPPRALLRHMPKDVQLPPEIASPN